MFVADIAMIPVGLELGWFAVVTTNFAIVDLNSYGHIILWYQNLIESCL